MADLKDPLDGLNRLRPTRDETVDLLSRLVGTESVNPSLVPGAAGEARIATLVSEWLSAAGLEVHVQDAAEGRPNVVARLSGRGRGHSLMLNAHVDTVGTAGMEDPFSARVVEDRLYGRGAYDMKGGLAAVMLAARALSTSGVLEGDLLVAAVADEEYASLGTQAVLESWTADGAIVTEPTGLRVCVAHKGFAWVTVKTRGRAAHGSKPDLGVDSIVHMGRVLADLEALGGELRARPPHPLLGTGSVHASLIEGGQELSSYPERCKLQIERRTVPGEAPGGVLGEIQSMLDRRSAADPAFSASADLFVWRDPFEVDLAEPLVQTLIQEAGGSGQIPEIYGDTPWMDAALLSAAGIPTVVFGPGGTGAHAIEEYVSISEVQDCAYVLARTALRFCRTR